MKNIKQLIEVRKTDSTSEKLGALIESGLLDQDKAFQVHRALTKENISPALLELVENLVIEALDKKESDYLAKYDHRKEKNAKDPPAIIILKRKAIRVYPDNQRIALYYSQQLDRYVSIPYGEGSRALGMEINEGKVIPFKKKTKEPQRSTSQAIQPTTTDEYDPNNSVHTWHHSRVLESDHQGQTVTSSQAYDNYQDFCKNHKKEPLSITKFHSQWEDYSRHPHMKIKGLTVHNVKLHEPPKLNESFANNLRRLRIDEARRTRRRNSEDLSVRDLPAGAWRDLARQSIEGEAEKRAKLNVAQGLTQRQLLKLDGGEDIAKQTIRDSGLPPLTRLGLRHGLFINKLFTTPTQTPAQDPTPAVTPQPQPNNPPAQPPPAATRPSRRVQEEKSANDFSEPLTREQEEALKKDAITSPSVGPVELAVGGGAALGIRAVGATGRAIAARTAATRTATTRTRTLKLKRKPEKGGLGTTAAAGALAGAESKKTPESKSDEPSLFRDTQSDIPFTQAGRAQAKVGAPPRTSGDAAIAGANKYNWNSPSAPTAVRESSISNLEVIRLIAEQDKSYELNVADKSIPMNPKVARKIVKVYESLNKRNQIKMKRMLNESATTFRKAVNFALKF
jgi:hypothetical protein